MTSTVDEFPFAEADVIAPAGYGERGHPHEVFTWLRRHAPMRRMTPQGYEPFYAAVRHADILEIERNPEVFRNAPRDIIFANSQGGGGFSEEQYGEIARRLERPELIGLMAETEGRLIRSLVQMDAPDHTRYRALVQPWFIPRNMRKLEDQLVTITREILDDMMGDGSERECDFVQDVAGWHPLKMICRLLGTRPEDEEMILRLTNELFAGEDEEMRRQGSDPLSIFDTIRDLYNYFIEVTEERRRNPGDDLATFIANGRIDGEYLPFKELISYYIIVATAGHETTRTAMSGGLLALLQNPVQYAKLAADPSGDAMKLAVEEMIRWSTPVNQFGRTAMEDYEIRGKTIRAGESVGLFYASANRDEDVFDDPFAFRVDRSPNRHLAFGTGPHMCLGNLLARMEMRVFFEQLLPRIESMELAGDPAFLRASFVHGLKHLPIRYRLRPAA